jgi:hypothetical protein
MKYPLVPTGAMQWMVPSAPVPGSKAGSTLPSGSSLAIRPHGVPFTSVKLPQISTPPSPVGCMAITAPFSAGAKESGSPSTTARAVSAHISHSNKARRIIVAAGFL